MFCACINARFVEHFNAIVGSPIECSNLKVELRNVLYETRSLSPVAAVSLLSCVLLRLQLHFCCN
jgi:hypothetical protein